MRQDRTIRLHGRPTLARTRGHLGHRTIWLVLCLLGMIGTSAVASPRTVRVGVYQNPPKIFFARGRISGIFGDLLYAIADREGWTIEPVVCSWRQCLEKLQAGQIDLMPDVAFNKPRAQLMDFGKTPTLYSWSELYRNPNVRLMSIRDLSDKRVAVLSGSIQETYLSEMARNYGIRGVVFMPTENLNAAFELAASGKADAVATNYFFGDAEARQYHLDSTPIIFQPSQLFFAAPKGRGQALLNAIDFYLEQWETTPQSPYYRILDHWKTTARETHIPVLFWWGLGALGGLLSLALLAMWVQRRQVLAQDRHLRITEDKLALILDSVDACIYIKDTELRYQYVNHRQAELVGLPAKKILGQTDDVLYTPEVAIRMRVDDRRVLEHGERLTVEEENRSANGVLRRTYLTVKQPLRDDDGEIYALCGIATDFTEHKRNQQKIHQLAFYDPLTGLPNRSLLLDRAKHALDNYVRSQSVGALLFIDLDNFKILNDTLGHGQGDILLGQAATRLGAQVRHNDTLARLGGDEFVLLMENLGETLDTAISDVENIARKLLQAFTEPFQLDNGIYNITASIGVALFSEADHRVEELLKRADMAMYEAKASGRDQVKFFNPMMQASLSARAAVETELHEALKHEQFILLYQPQVGCEGRLLGAEALVRWQHPRDGLVSPAVFIPVAESTGQILMLGRWILHTACLQLVAWQGKPEYAGLVLSVNVSARQFHHPDFVSEVLRTLDETGADPTHLGLELTETLLADDIDNLIAKMKALKARGVRFSLDDFGTGYSSLSYLKRLPLDQLKIDQSFVRDLLVDPNDTAIVRTILALGESLDLEVMAEGVETIEQRDALLNLGCRRQQGYFFGYPGPPEALLDGRANAR
ncbi:EAL domain-containing protein [Acidihalobacter yilgarnensis]|nr:EAL domain-containing protein [Acidihalobacter yilgarnensis]